MRKYVCQCLTLTLAVFQFQNAHAQADDRDAILELMEKTFAAVRSSEPDDWREYEFWIDGQWKVANFMWTVERDNCPAAP